MNRIGDDLHCTGSNKEIVQVFSELGVEFVLIGGLAVAWYCADRQADDMDLLVNPTEENAIRICQALSRLRYSFIDPKSLCRPGVQVPLKQNHYAELLTPRTDGPSYESVVQHAVQGRVLGVPTLIASAQSLIELKRVAVAYEEAAMQKHLRDIECLEPHAA